MGKLDEIPMEDLKQRPGKGRIKNEDKILVGSGKSRTKLTPKQAKFVKAKIEGKNNTEAAMIAYDTDNPKTASVIAAENLEKPSIQAALLPAAEKNGIDAEYMMQILAEAMAATKSVTLLGEVLESDVPDHSVRLTAVKTAAALLGVGKDPDAGKSGDTFNFNFGDNNFIKKVDNGS